MSWTINDQSPESLGVTIASWSEDALDASELILDLVVQDYSADLPDGLGFNDTVVLKKGSDQLFKGKVRHTPRNANGSSESLSITVLDAFDQLDRLTYQQTRSYVESITTANDNEASIIEYSDKAIGLAMWEDDVKLGTRISQIITYAASKGVDIAIGNIADGLDWWRSEYKDMTCGELISEMMRVMPEYVFYIDNRQTTPTANMVLRSSMDTISYDIVTDGVVIENNILSHESEQVPGVSIRYEQPLSLNGVNKTGVVIDEAGDVDAIGAVTETVSINGKSANYEYEQVVTHTVPQADALEEDILKWWIEHTPELKQIKELKSEAALLSILKLATADKLDNNVHKHFLKVIANEDDELAPINPRAEVVRKSLDPVDYSRQLIEGNLPEYAGKRARTVEAVATLGIEKATWETIADDEIKALLSTHFAPTKKFDGKEYYTATLTGSFTGTNAQSQTYKRNVTYDNGETPPTGLAAQLLEQYSQLRHSGQLSLKGQEPDTIPRPGKKLNITGGRSEWGTMGESIQRVSYSIADGAVDITFGPPQQLGANDLIERLRANQRNSYSHGLRADKENTEGVGGTIATARNAFQLKPDTQASAGQSHYFGPLEVYRDEDGNAEVILVPTHFLEITHSKVEKHEVKLDGDLLSAKEIVSLTADNLHKLYVNFKTDPLAELTGEVTAAFTTGAVPESTNHVPPSGGSSGTDGDYYKLIGVYDVPASPTSKIEYHPVSSPSWECLEREFENLGDGAKVHKATTKDKQSFRSIKAGTGASSGSSGTLLQGTITFEETADTIEAKVFYTADDLGGGPSEGEAQTAIYKFLKNKTLAENKLNFNDGFCIGDVPAWDIRYQTPLEHGSFTHVDNINDIVDLVNANQANLEPDGKKVGFHPYYVTIAGEVGGAAFYCSDPKALDLDVNGNPTETPYDKIDKLDDQAVDYIPQYDSPGTDNPT